MSAPLARAGRTVKIVPTERLASMFEDPSIGSTATARGAPGLMGSAHSSSSEASVATGAAFERGHDEVVGADVDVLLRVGPTLLARLGTQGPSERAPSDEARYLAAGLREADDAMAMSARAASPRAQRSRYWPSSIVSVVPKSPPRAH